MHSSCRLTTIDYRGHGRTNRLHIIFVLYRALCGCEIVRVIDVENSGTQNHRNCCCLECYVLAVDFLRCILKPYYNRLLLYLDSRLYTIQINESSLCLNVNIGLCCDISVCCFLDFYSLCRNVGFSVCDRCSISWERIALYCRYKCQLPVSWEKMTNMTVDVEQMSGNNVKKINSFAEPCLRY
uniref:Uncharacterized protein n=1 Tax=Rhipicephalus zambeziensis TaxID=60191 RepID=A0A224Y5B3_9ACAR